MCEKKHNVLQCGFREHSVSVLDLFESINHHFINSSHTSAAVISHGSMMYDGSSLTVSPTC